MQTRVDLCAFDGYWLPRACLNLGWWRGVELRSRGSNKIEIAIFGGFRNKFGCESCLDHKSVTVTSGSHCPAILRTEMMDDEEPNTSNVGTSLNEGITDVTQQNSDIVTQGHCNGKDTV
jgi:hypothetical protein